MKKQNEKLSASVFRRNFYDYVLYIIQGDTCLNAYEFKDVGNLLETLTKFLIFAPSLLDLSSNEELVEEYNNADSIIKLGTEFIIVAGDKITIYADKVSSIPDREQLANFILDRQTITLNRREF